MILYGRNLSPFVRRIAIWAAMQNVDVERRSIMVTGDDVDRLKAMNPAIRVPVVELPNGERMIETFAIIDWLEEEAAPAARLLPAGGEERRRIMQLVAFANTAAEKSVALVYEKDRRPAEFQWPEWRDRLVMQVRGALQALEALLPESGFTGGATPNGADIAMVCAFDFAEETNAALLTGDLPRLRAMSEMANELDEFAACHPSKPL